MPYSPAYGLVSLLVLALASGQLANIWLQDGGLFEEWRDRISVYRGSGRPILEKLAKLFTCRFCLTIQFSLWLSIGSLILEHTSRTGWLVFWAVLLSLAASRVSLWGQTVEQASGL